MLKNNLAEKYKDQLIRIIRRYVPHGVIYLFGSRARKDYKAGSDIDIAIDAGAPLEFRIISKIITEIEDTTIPLFVDVVDVQTISEQMKEQIENEGIVWAK